MDIGVEWGSRRVGPNGQIQTIGEWAGQLAAPGAAHVLSQCLETQEEAASVLENR